MKTTGSDTHYFPDDLMPDENGLVAVGGALSPELLIEAYSKGIFPWSSVPRVGWYSPDPRLVLYPDQFHLSRRTLRIVKNPKYQVRFDDDFQKVMFCCSRIIRNSQEGTWITDDFIRAYSDLHSLGLTHSVEVYNEERLVGGLYGVSLGKIFFGESMFSIEPNTSKLAMYYLVEFLIQHHFDLIDCQAPTQHLLNLGAVEIPRKVFLKKIKKSLKKKTLTGNWELLRR